jgi:hypothetical protein
MSITTNGARFIADATGLPGVSNREPDILAVRRWRRAYARRADALPDPGTVDPGTVDPGTVEPGAVDPRTVEPFAAGSLVPPGVLSSICWVVMMPPP